MALVSFTAEIAELVGKLAGSTFQYSYGGYQVHTRVVPANPQTNRQQLRRGWFGWIAANWRNLTTSEQGTFIAAAGSIRAGFRLFITVNINLYLIEEPTCTSYTSSLQPPEFDCDITTYAGNDLQIIAAGPSSIVPANHSLLIYATYEKSLSKIFTNPSEFSPIQIFAAGSNLSTAQNITPAWNTLYGQMHGSRQLCIKSVLINTTNGMRGDEFIICTGGIPPTEKYLIDSDLAPIIDSNGDHLVWEL